jgi:ABC-2 type transport system permease protein
MGFPFGISIYGLLNMFTSFLLCRPIVEDRMRGVLLRISAAPVSYVKYAASHLSAYLLIICIQIAVFITGISIIYQFELLQYVQIAILYITFSVMTTALAVAWNSLFTSYSLSFGLFSGFGSVMALLSGVSIPLVLIPQTLQTYTRFLPTYWLPYGLDAIYSGDISGLIISVVILLCYAFLFILAGTKRKL